MEPVSRTITTPDGVKLYTQVKENGSNVWLIATHGIGEHLSRHEYLKELFGHDVNVFQYDLRGHGRSGGEKAYISNFSMFMEDLKFCINYLKEKYGMERYILFGHSMGALITAGYVKSYLDDDFLPEAVIINAPPAAIPGALGNLVEKVPSNIISKLASFKASIPLGGLVELKYLSHKQEVIDDYVEDKLNHLKLHSKLLLEMIKCSREVFSTPINPKCKAYVSYGTEDGIVSAPAIDDYFTNVEKKFELTAIEGAYHEIHNEIDRFKKPYFDYLKSAVTQTVFPSETN